MTENLMDRCVRCGSCHAACPMFQLTHDEGRGARGRIAILQQLYRNGERFSSETLGLLQDCVMCGSCQYTCPRDVAYLDIMRSARNQAIQDGQESPLKRMVLKILKQQSSWKGMNALLRVFPGESGLICKLPLVDRYMPRPGTVLEHRIKTVNEPATPVPEKTVLFFPGCTMRYVFPEMGERLVHLLNRAGWTILFDPDTGCCGFPHAAAGDVETADSLAAHNNDRFRLYAERAGSIVTGCATCGARLKDVVPPELSVLDINELLVSGADQLSFDVESKEPVLYHPPCHLARHQNIVAEPLELLSRVATVIPLDENPSCCGFGGSFSLFEAELSREIADAKTEKIKQQMEKTGTTPTMVTSCPGCVLQLTDALNRNGVDMKVKHIVDILYERLEEMA